MGLVFNGTSGTDKISAVDGTLTIDGVATINSITSPIITGDLSISDTIVHTGDTNTKIRFPSADTFTVETAGSERIRIDSSGRVLQGSSASRTIAITAALPQRQLEGVGSNASSFAIICNQNASAGPVISLGKTRGGAVGGTTVVQSGDSLGHISFEGSDGSNQRSGARITASVDGTPGSSDMPGRLMFYTTPDGSATEVERLRINSSGHMILSPSGYSLPTGDERTLNIVAWGNKPASLGFQRSNSLGGSTAGWSNELQSNGDLIWGVHNVGEKVRITSAGKVGINQSSPDGMLHVFSASAGSVNTDADADELTLENSGNVGLSLLTAATGESSIYFGNPGTNGQKDGWIKYYHESHSTSNNRRALTFKSGGGDEKMRLDSSGRLSIGLSPGTVGDAYYYDDIVVNNMSGGSGGAGGAGIQLLSHSGSWGGLIYGDQTSNCQIGYVKYNHGDNSMLFGVNSGEKFRFAASGQLGIGGANYGSSGQVLTSQGASAAPQWATAASGGWTVHKDATTAFGNALIEQTSGLSASTDVIQIIGYKLRCGNGSGTEISVQLGTSGGYGGTYNGMQRYFNSSGSQETHQDHDQSAWAAWHGQGNPFSQTNMEFSGTLTITRMGGNNFVMESQCLAERTDNNTQYLLINAGRLELGGALTKLKVYTQSGNNFSHGNLTIRSM